MHTISNETGVRAPRRRKHSPEFKAQVVAACQPLGVSIAAVAMANGVNANLARRWIVEARQRGGAHLVPAAVAPAFIPVCQQPAEPASLDIRIELRRGATAISVSWPCQAAAQCAAWMRELLR
ncbi:MULTISPECIES: IS66-like element accessory protein TnpA [unclassified Polaromonas]|uniref:IS66-like element accessory protein TnpA n=1 Tax=unclassified Polaromonas TaxID=2638319 RepID=UPI00114216D5|nr:MULTISPECIES: transposase [unclassified Polaromonas]MDI1273421.1 transposase [Polaromonas sp.]MDP2451302.1 transposase [Polaromonas sp.]